MGQAELWAGAGSGAGRGTGKTAVVLIGSGVGASLGSRIDEDVVEHRMIRHGGGLRTVAHVDA